MKLCYLKRVIIANEQAPIVHSEDANERGIRKFAIFHSLRTIGSRTCRSNLCSGLPNVVLMNRFFHI
jgi:hypothetical protein